MLNFLEVYNKENFTGFYETQRGNFLEVEYYLKIFREKFPDEFKKTYDNESLSLDSRLMLSRVGFNR